MKKVRILFSLALVLCLTLAMAACGGDTSSSSDAASTPAASTPVSTASEAASTPAGSTGGDTADMANLQAIADKLIAAADIDNAIDMMELDLKAGGVPVDDILGFVGVTSQNYSDNGGLVLVIQAKPGMAEDVKAGVEALKASRQDDRYTEFATQVANTKDGRVQTSGDIVVFAVSATAQDGGWDKLDAALSEALA